MKVTQAARRRTKAPRIVGTAPIAPGSRQPPQAGAGLPLPHERDESTHTTAEASPQGVIAQAHKDIEAGLVDTDLRATPGLDAERREKLVRRGR